MNSQEDPPDDKIIVQVVMVEQKDVWKIIAQDQISIREFEDQHVHQRMLNIPVFPTPVIVESLTFKNKKEISDFGDFVE